MHRNALGIELLFTVGAEFIIAVLPTVLFKKIRISAFGTSDRDRFIIRNPFAVRVSGTGIKRFSFFGIAFDDIAFAAFGTFDAQTDRP